MRGGRVLTGLQEIHVVLEYQQAIKLGAKERADRIYAANPDLHVQLDQALEELNNQR